mmetsp:Transcript_25232/g.77786  ORF Transcript_25232/g.77786 Transcript_25232/m.77786 type:complete len:280 (+) Transcript_25232:225-1064(+)
MPVRAHQNRRRRRGRSVGRDGGAGHQPRVGRAAVPVLRRGQLSRGILVQVQPRPDARDVDGAGALGRHHVTLEPPPDGRAPDVCARRRVRRDGHDAQRPVRGADWVGRRLRPLRVKHLRPAEEGRDFVSHAADGPHGGAHQLPRRLVRRSDGHAPALPADERRVGRHERRPGREMARPRVPRGLRVTRRPVGALPRLGRPALRLLLAGPLREGLAGRRPTARHVARRRRRRGSLHGAPGELHARARFVQGAEPAAVPRDAARAVVRRPTSRLRGSMSGK